MKNERESFIFYKSFYEALKETKSKKIKLEVLEAIIELGLNGKEIELSGTSKALFVLIKPQIEANYKRYENGKRGGRPRQNQNETEIKSKNNQNETKQQPNVNVNVNDNVNVNVLGYSETTLPPTLDTLLNYCLEKFSDCSKNDLKKSCQKFIRYYNENGWNKVKKIEDKLWLWINDDITNGKIKEENNFFEIGSTKGLPKL